MRQPEQKSTWWSAALVLSAVVAVMTPAILLAASGSGTGFEAVVHGLESRYHVHATKIPFMGLISLVAGHATHGGVKSLHVAEIDNLREPIDGAELNSLVAERVGPGWKRIVRETGRDGAEQSLIYVKPEGNRLAMLVVDLDHHELDIVQVSLNPDKLSDEIANHHHGILHDSEEDKHPDSPKDDDAAE